MIVYNSRLAKCFPGRRRHYFMLFGICFTRFRYLEAWEEMELRIHERQFTECVLLAFLPAMVLSLLFSWWCMLLLPLNYHLLYCTEKKWGHHSAFDWEALEYCGDALYMRKRENFAWMKYYFRKSLPESEWDD